MLIPFAALFRTSFIYRLPKADTGISEANANSAFHIPNSELRKSAPFGRGAFLCLSELDNCKIFVKLPRVTFTFPV